MAYLPVLKANQAIEKADKTQAELNEMVIKSLNLLNKNDPGVLTEKYFNKNGVITDFSGGFISHAISAKSGDTISITLDTGFNDLIGVYYDKNGTNLGLMNSTRSADKTYRYFTLPNDNAIDHVKVHASLSKIDNIMVVKNETFPDSYVDYEKRLSNVFKLNETQLKEVNNANGILYGKIYSNNGDSIAAATPVEAGGGYAQMIADQNDMTLENIASNGGTITAETYTSGGSPRHWVSRTIADMRSDADYVILEGGTNDASLEVPLGSISSGYTATLDDTTFCGALESTFKQAYDRFPESKIGFIIVHKIFDETRYWTTDIYPKIKEICEKWGVPYIDLNTEAPPLNFITYFKNNYTVSQDGWHPNEEGYRLFYLNKIESWMKSL